MKLTTVLLGTLATFESMILLNILEYFSRLLSLWSFNRLQVFSRMNTALNHVTVKSSFYCR